MRRPVSVTVSSWLLAIGALLSATDLGLSYHGQQARDEAYWAAVEANEIDGGAAFAAVTAVGGGCILGLWIVCTCPGWYGGVALAVDFALLACLFSAVVLLAVRPASRYFQSVRSAATP